MQIAGSNFFGVHDQQDHERETDQKQHESVVVELRRVTLGSLHQVANEDHGQEEAEFFNRGESFSVVVHAVVLLEVVHGFVTDKVQPQDVDTVVGLGTEEGGVVGAEGAGRGGFGESGGGFEEGGGFGGEHGVVEVVGEWGCW